MLDEKERWSAEVIRKAEDLVAEGRVHEDLVHPNVWWVMGSKQYRVQTDGETWITCNCPNGLHVSHPSCYHTAAVLMVIRDEKGPR